MPKKDGHLGRSLMRNAKREDRSRRAARREAHAGERGAPRAAGAPRRACVVRPLGVPRVRFRSAQWATTVGSRRRMH